MSFFDNRRKTPRYVSLKGACQMLRVDELQFKNLQKRGIAPPVRLDKWGHPTGEYSVEALSKAKEVLRVRAGK